MTYLCQFTDIDECLSVVPCQHSCVNIPGSYACECRDGYDLNTDGISCTGKNLNRKAIYRTLDISSCFYL